jgi:hypothetical protein
VQAYDRGGYERDSDRDRSREIAKSPASTSATKDRDYSTDERFTPEQMARVDKDRINVRAVAVFACALQLALSNFMSFDRQIRAAVVSPVLRAVQVQDIALFPTNDIMYLSQDHQARKSLAFDCFELLRPQPSVCLRVFACIVQERTVFEVLIPHWWSDVIRNYRPKSDEEVRNLALLLLR